MKCSFERGHPRSGRSSNVEKVGDSCDGAAVMEEMDTGEGCGRWTREPMLPGLPIRLSCCLLFGVDLKSTVCLVSYGFFLGGLVGSVAQSFLGSWSLTLRKLENWKTGVTEIGHCEDSGK